MQSLAERGARPGDDDQSTFSSEQELASAASRDALAHGNPTTPPEWSERAFERWKQENDALAESGREDGGGDNTLQQNPPLFYAYQVIPYKAGGGIFSRLYLMRVFSALLLLVTVTGAWLLAGEVFGRNRELQLATAAVVGLAPMATFISAAVNPDAMLFAASSIALWLGVRIIRRGFTFGQAAALLAVVGLGFLAKPTALVLFPAALVAIAVGAWRSPHISRRTIAISAALVVVVAAPPTVLLASRLSEERFEATGPSGRSAPGLGDLDVAEFGSYLAAFYLPQAFGGELEDGRGTKIFPEPTIYPLYDVWVKEGIGAFGWLDTYFPKQIYAAVALVLALVAASAGLVLYRSRRKLDWGIAAFLGIAVIAVLGALHLTEYQYLYAHGSKFNEGRYLLPFLPLAGLAASAALTLVPRHRATALALLLGGLFALQLFSLAIVAGRFYA